MLENVAFVGGIGCLLFTGWLLLFALSGWVKFLRNEAGEFRKNWSWQKVLGMLVFVVFIFGILLWGNLRLKLIYIKDPTYIELFLNSFGTFMIIHLYDLIVIDYLLIVCWHPKFLNLPDTPYYQQLKPHLKGFKRGIPIGIAAGIIAATISSI